MKLPEVLEKFAFVFLRVIIGFIFISHGVARLFYWSILDFGGFLNSIGLIVGVPLAWVITIGEIVSGACMILGFKVRYCVIFHLLVIVPGIFIIHLPNGWFTVGHGSGGIEYSLLLVAVLIYIYSKVTKKT